MLRKKIAIITLCLAGIAGLTGLLLHSYGGFVRDAGWEARQDHWKDSSKKMFWELFNQTDEKIIAQSDIEKILIKPKNNEKLYRETDFTIYMDSKSGLHKRINTRQHFVTVTKKDEKLRAKPSRTEPKNLSF